MKRRDYERKRVNYKALSNIAIVSPPAANIVLNTVQDFPTYLLYKPLMLAKTYTWGGLHVPFFSCSIGADCRGQEEDTPY